MVSRQTMESLVGLFILAALIAFVFLAFKVSGLTSFIAAPGYTVTAAFDNIGQLKVRAPVKLAGVSIGEVTDIQLDPTTFKATVKMRINAHVNMIPSDSSASILTAGLLGDNFISLTPMYNKDYLKQGSYIEETQSAIILENMISQLMFKMSSSTSSNANKT